MNEPTYTLGRRPALDVVRGLAVLGVITQHSWAPWTGNAGNLGVTLFLALSGFLITRLLFEELRRDGRLNLRRFYVRRARRLGPALALFLLFMAVIGPQFHVTPWMLTLTALQVANVAIASGQVFWAVAHMWSLSMEEQFYVLWPALLGLVALRRSRRAVVGGLLVVALACALWRSWLQLDGAPLMRVLFGPDTRVDALALGCTLALSMDWLTAHIGQSARRVVGMTGAVTLLALAPLTGQGGAWSLLPGALASCAVVFWAGTATSILALGGVAPVLRWCGKVSYGAYLWHVPVAMLLWDVPYWWVRLPVTLLVAFGVAAVSWRVVERTFRHSKNAPRLPVGDEGRTVRAG